LKIIVETAKEGTTPLQAFARSVQRCECYLSERSAPIMTTSASAHYDRATIVLHWLTAALVVVLWIIGQTADWTPRGPIQTAYWSIHVVLGFVLAIALA
jgi:hypothetical protein